MKGVNMENRLGLETLGILMEHAQNLSPDTVVKQRKIPHNNIGGKLERFSTSFFFTIASLILDWHLIFAADSCAVWDFKEITNHFRRVYRIYLQSIKEKRRRKRCQHGKPVGLGNTRNLDGTCPKSLPEHCCEATLIPYNNIGEMVKRCSTSFFFTIATLMLDWRLIFAADSCAVWDPNDLIFRSCASEKWRELCGQYIPDQPTGVPGALENFGMFSEGAFGNVIVHGELSGTLTYMKEKQMRGPRSLELQPSHA